MLSFFFYGTLTDPDLRDAVLGGPAAAVRPAVLHGYRRAIVAGRDYPGIAPARGDAVQGLLAAGITPAMAARASVYEGDQYETALVSVTTEDGAVCDAWTFLPARGLRLGTRGWDLETWQRRRKAMTVKAAHVHMTGISPSAFGRRLAAWRER